MQFVKFMASSAGRWLRALVGIALLVVGATQGNMLWYGIFGVFFIAVALLDVCVFAPLFGMPLSGKKIRAGK
jgi:hypothetical protein